MFKNIDKILKIVGMLLFVLQMVASIIVLIELFMRDESGKLFEKLWYWPVGLIISALILPMIMMGIGEILTRVKLIDEKIANVENKEVLINEMRTTTRDGISENE